MADDLRAGQEILDLRLLRLEKEGDDRELRMRMLEKEAAETRQRLEVLDKVEKIVDEIRSSQSKMMFAVIIGIVSVLGTFILGHFGPVPK